MDLKYRAIDGCEMETIYPVNTVAANKAHLIFTCFLKSTIWNGPDFFFMELIAKEEKPQPRTIRQDHQWNAYSTGRSIKIQAEVFLHQQNTVAGAKEVETDREGRGFLQAKGMKRPLSYGVLCH